MSNSTPPLFPLLKAELPSSCKIKDEDIYTHDLNTNLERLLLLANESQNRKKRAADEEQNSKLNSDIKRRLTIKDEEKDQKLDRSSGNDENNESSPKMDVDYSDSVQDQDSLFQTQTSQALVTHTPPSFSAPSETSVSNLTESNELSLPSPSASPKQYNFDDEVMVEQDQSFVNSKSLVDVISSLSTSTLSKSALNNLIFKLISQADRTTLSDFRDTIDKGLKRDFLMSLPLEISFKVLKELDYKSLNNVLLVSKNWNKLISSTLWKKLLIQDNLIEKHELENDSPNYFHKLYMERYELLQNWTNPDFEPKKVTVLAHGSNVVTCLQFDDEKIISGADDKMINIYNPENGELLKVLQGHEGGVWALKYIGNQIVSGSTDRTVRVWNLKSGKCTHIFRGHTSTIRCMEIVTDEETGERQIITGSRDNSLHVWRLPDEDDLGENFDDQDPFNPYFVTALRGHTASVRAVTGKGNLVISGSYDNTVRVWDLKKKDIKFVLRGHTDRIYSTILDAERNRCISASMDSTIRVWDLNTGECISEMTQHASLVGLLGLSSKALVSAATDGTLRVWDPNNYTNDLTLHHADHAAITTFDLSPNLLVSGSEGQFNAYDLRNKGKLIRSNLLGHCGQIWSAKISHSKCVVALEKNSQSVIEIIDFSKRAS